MEDTVLGQPLDRRDPLTRDPGGFHLTRLYWPAPDQNGARAAGTLPAAELRPRNAEISAQPVEQRLPGPGGQLELMAVDDDGVGHALDLSSVTSARTG